MVNWPLPTGEDLEVTIDNIKSLNKQTNDAIDELSDSLSDFHDLVQESKDYFQDQLQIKHLKDTINNRPNSTEKGTIFIIKS